MRTDELAYELPEELIARYPPPERGQSRLLVLAGEGSCVHRRFGELPALLPPGALLVVNDTRVLPARLLGHKPSGGRAEVLLVERQPGDEPVVGVQRWRAMVRGLRKVGAEAALGERLVARLLETRDADGLALVALAPARPGDDVGELVEAEGHIPLPPYLGRPDEPCDRDRYQTLFARAPGAVAAPTAGLHFGEGLLAELRAEGVELASLTLHVGPGTFRPVTVADLDDHAMHAESFVIPPETAARIAAARGRGAPVIAVGTTVVRALESAAAGADATVQATAGRTRLLIQPGHRFRVVDGLITNFHLPGSTLLALVFAFAGAAAVRAGYRAAIAERYRFFSYGDAMYVPPSAAVAGAPRGTRP